MGFFKSIFKKPQNIFRSAGVVATNFYTAGLINLAPKKVQNAAVSAYALGAQAVVSSYTGGLSDVALAATASKPSMQPSSLTGDTPMAFSFDTNRFLTGVGQALGGSSNPYFSTIGTLAQIGSAFAPQPVAQRMPGAQGAPQVINPRNPYMRSGPVSVGRSLFNKFPNLAAGINALRMAGKNVSRGKLYSMVRRFGPDFLITGGILSAAAISELMMAGPGRRRMNPANSKALRRSVRRIKSFHKLCQSTDIIRAKGSRTRGRCVKCKQSPCGC